MKTLKELPLIILFYILGEGLSFLIKQLFPFIIIPGSILGMIMLFILLLFKIIRLPWIKSISEFFINNMAFFFIPSVVSLLAFFDMLSPIIWKLLIILTISFLLTFISVGLSVKLALFLKRKDTKNND